MKVNPWDSIANLNEGKEALTWDGRTKSGGIGLDNTILECPPPDSLSTNQDEGFSLERRHPCHLLINHHLMTVEFWEIKEKEMHTLQGMKKSEM